MTAPAKKMDPIKKVTLKDGSTRYRFVIDVGRKVNGKRDQKTFTYDSLREARAARSKIIAARATGTFVRPEKTTVAQAAQTWLEGKRNLRPGTRRTYTDNLAHAVDRIGHLEIQKVTKGNIDDLITKMLAGGRRVGNVRRQALSPRTVNATLIVLGAVFDSCVRQGILGRNVVKLAERPAQTRTEMQTWTAEHASAFLTAVTDDRLFAAWQLSLYGLRRGEVLGLRWSDVDLVKRSLTISNTRTSVAGQCVEGAPKTERGRRTLPLDADLVAALDGLALSQREDADAAGEAYQPICPLCAEAHVVADELGRPYRPEWYGDRFEALAKAAGMPAIRLHDARHTCGTLMHLRGVPTAVISAWLGHATASFTLATYVHSQDDALAEAGETLRKAFAGAVRAPQTAE